MYNHLFLLPVGEVYQLQRVFSRAFGFCRFGFGFSMASPEEAYEATSYQESTNNSDEDDLPGGKGWFRGRCYSSGRG